MSEQGTDGVTLTCTSEKHGEPYTWVYTGDMERATCPSCGGKVPVSSGES